MRGRAHAKKPRTQKHTRIHNNRELKQTRSMRGRAHSTNTRTHATTIDARARAFKKTRTQTNKLNARARAFKNNANSSKHDRCESARIQQKLRTQANTLMCGRAHANKSRTQSNNVNARARVFKKTENASKQGQCAGAQKHCEFKETISM